MEGKCYKIRSTMFDFSLSVFGDDLRKVFGYYRHSSKEMNAISRKFVSDVLKLMKQYNKDYKKIARKIDADL